MPDYAAMWEQYKKDVLNRVQNPGQTLATALQQGMPTEQNPLGMFGFGGMTKVGKGMPQVFHSYREGVELPSFSFPQEMLSKLDKNHETTHFLGKKLYKLKDGSYIDETGLHMFENDADLAKAFKNLEKAKVKEEIYNPNYKPPFEDTTR